MSIDFQDTYTDWLRQLLIFAVRMEFGSHDQGVQANGSQMQHKNMHKGGREGNMEQQVSNVSYICNELHTHYNVQDPVSEQRICWIILWKYILTEVTSNQRNWAVKEVVGAESTSPHTSWKYAKETESSEWWSMLNQQVHIHPGNAQERWNCQISSQCSINKFTHQLEMPKGEGIIRAAVSA